MNNFKVGDWVYAGDYHGQIVEIGDDYAMVEFDTSGGGGCLPFDFSELEHADDPNSPEYIAKGLLWEFDRLVDKAKEMGFDIRSATNSTHSLRLYYHEDYPNLLLVDKDGGVDI